MYIVQGRLPKRKLLYRENSRKENYFLKSSTVTSPTFHEKLVGGGGEGGSTTCLVHGGLVTGDGMTLTPLFICGWEGGGVRDGGEGLTVFSGFQPSPRSYCTTADQIPQNSARIHTGRPASALLNVKCVYKWSYVS